MTNFGNGFDLRNFSMVKIWGSLKGRSPFKLYPSPSPLKERGTQGVR